jgi:WD40 repeat protein
MRKLFFLPLFLLIFPTLTWAQGLDDPALQAAIAAANQADPNLGRPLRWEFEILLPTTDSALSCPLVPGVQLANASTPYIVTLFFGGPDGEVPYVVHVARDGGSAQRCDTKFPNMGMSTVSLLPAATAATPCTVVPSGPFANVRAAPDTEAEQTTTIESARQALGRNADFTWYLIAEGWVAGTVVTNTGDCLSNNLSIRDTAIARGLAPSAQTTAVPGQPTAVAQAPTTIPQTDFTCPEGFDGYLPPRIRTGQITAQVEQGGVPNSLRRQPIVNSDRVGSIQPGRRLDLVIDGPECSDGFVWWLVEIDGVRGWTAESSFSGGNYFLAPTPGNEVTVDGEEFAAIPVQPGSAGVRSPVIESGAVTGLSEGFTLNLGDGLVLGALQADYTLIWAAGDEVFTAAFPPTDGGILIDQLTAGRFTSLTPDTTGWLYAGQDSGVIRAYNMGVAASVNAHESPVNVLTVAPSGELVATGSGGSNTDAATWALRLWEPGVLQGAQSPVEFTRSIRFPYPVTDVAFSGDGGYMAVVAQRTGAEPAAAIWIYDEGGLGGNVVTLALEAGDAGSAFVTAEPDGNGFFYGRDNAVFRLDPGTGEEANVFTVTGSSILRDLAFNPVGDGVAAIASDASLTFTTLAQLRGESPFNTPTPIPVSAVQVQFSATGDILLVQTGNDEVVYYTVPVQ